MKRPLGYLDGLGTGIAAIALLGALGLAVATQRLEFMYRDFGPGVRMPASTKLVLGTAWQTGVPFAMFAALVVGHVWRPKYLLVGAAVVAVAVDVFWYLAAWAPIFQVSGNIR